MEQYQEYNKIFNNWHVKRHIDSGSYGEVFEMERIEGSVIYRSALKVIKIPQKDSEIKEKLAEGQSREAIVTYYRGVADQLLNENHIMAELKGHSNIVSYEDHEVVYHEDGIGCDIFIRMELLTPFMKYMESHEIDEDTIIRLGIDICKALEVCEKKNIIHRDIKPANIFVSPAGDFKLGDFGIARTIARTASGLSKKGTYRFMAPEVYNGQAYGKAVDICSLGLVLYYLANGNRTPFLPPAPTPITFEEDEPALLRRMNGEAIPLPRNASPGLAQIILRACSHYPNNRYGSASEMRHALETLRSGQPVQEIDQFDSFTNKNEDLKQQLDQLGGRLTEGFDKLERSVPDTHDEEKQWTEPPEKKTNKAVIVLIIVLALLAGLAAGWFFILGSGGDGTVGTPFGGSGVLMTDVGVYGDVDDPDGMSQSYDLLGNDDYDRRDVKKIVFQDSIDNASDDAWDVSEDEDGSVLAWFEGGGTLNIGAKGGVTASSCYGLFASYEELETVDFNDSFDVGGEENDMGFMFCYDSSLKTIDFTGVDTYGVVNMDRMFAHCSSLQDAYLNDMDTSQVTNMCGLFCDCSELRTAEIDQWDTRSVTRMDRMFRYCYKLEDVDVSGFDTRNVTDMREMFYRCLVLDTIDVSGFDTSNVMNMYAMFARCEKVEILDVHGFKTGKVEDMSYMFNKCLCLKGLDVGSFDTREVPRDKVKAMFNGLDCPLRGYEDWPQYTSDDDNNMFTD